MGELTLGHLCGWMCSGTKDSTVVDADGTKVLFLETSARIVAFNGGRAGERNTGPRQMRRASERHTSFACLPVQKKATRLANHTELPSRQGCPSSRR